jgi:ATP-dependent Lon protease
VATLPSLHLRDVRIDVELVAANERMLTDGFYAEIHLEYDAVLAQEKGGRPFRVAFLRPIQLSTQGVLDELRRGRLAFSVTEWKHLLLRSIGFEPERLVPRAQDILLLSMVPFVERNYNMIELGPRGTGKSHIFQQISLYSHLVSGGKATVAQMFVNNSNGQRRLVCQYDVVCFDEVSGVSFDQKDGVNIMKGTWSLANLAVDARAFAPTSIHRATTRIGRCRKRCGSRLTRSLGSLQCGIG